MLARSAYHEAGHAVVALALGLPIKKVTIEPTETLRGSVSLDLADDDAPEESLTPAQRVKLGIVELSWALAGPLAEEIALGEADAGSRRDYRDADQAVERTDATMGTLPWQWRHWAATRVESYLRQNWDLVERLAVALLMQRTMTGTRVLEIVGGVPPLDTAAVQKGIEYWSGVMAARAKASA